MDSIDKELDTLMNFTHISYQEKIEKAKNELLSTDPKQVMRWGRQERDNMLGGIYGGKIYLIGAKTGIGKSTFVNQICRNVASQGYKVVKYSLEDRMEDIGKEEIYFEVNRLRYADNLQKYERRNFINNEIANDEFYNYVGLACENLSKIAITELDKQKQVTLENLCILMEQECDNGARMFAIDHLHYFEFQKTGERLDLQIQNVMHAINEIARRRNVAVFLVAHYKANVGNGEPDPDRFKDGASIKQVANVIIQIERKIDDIDNESEFYITKLRGPIKPKTITTKFDLGKFEYSFIQSKKTLGFL